METKIAELIDLARRQCPHLDITHTRQGKGVTVITLGSLRLVRAWDAATCQHAWACVLPCGHAIDAFGDHGLVEGFCGAIGTAVCLGMVDAYRESKHRVIPAEAATEEQPSFLPPPPVLSLLPGVKLPVAGRVEPDGRVVFHGEN